uniref:Organic cation transporter-like protein 2 n=1 Tax=Oncorhynchus kisutch TaxID=8019 RepID=A0A8C7KPC2_ONCKI
MSRVKSESPTAVTDVRTGSKMQRVIYVTYLIAVLDITWMFLQFSITPYLAKKLGFDTLWIGYLQTMVGVVQLLGGPIFGRFADLFGARAAMCLSCTASVVYYGLLAIADSPLMLFVHKLPAVLMHGLPGAQMVVTDLTEPDKRAEALGKLGLCFGIGMVAGSTLGGTLSTHYGETFAACVAAGGSFISFLLVWTFIPKHTKIQAPQDNTDKKSNAKSVFDLGEITRLMKYPGVAKTFMVKIISGLPSGIFQVMFSVIAMNFFQLAPEQNGYLMAYFGIVSMVFMANVFQFCFIVLPMMFSLSVFNVITDSMLTKTVPSSDTGTMLGLCASVQSLLRTIGPTIGGFLYHNYGVASFGFIQFAVNMVVFMFMLRNMVNTKDEHRE